MGNTGWGVVSILAAVLSCAAAIITLRYRSRQIRTAEGHSRLVAGAQVAAPFAAITQEYLDRRFRTADPPTIDGTTVHELRVAKAIAVKNYRRADARPLQPWFKNMPSRQTWRAASVLGRPGYENRIGYELSIAMERLGIAVFTGAVDAAFFLALAADQVLEDWPLCESWIESYRDENHGLMHRNGRVPFHRRHAEWLVLLSALWMHREFPEYAPLKVAIADFGDLPAIQDRFRHFSMADGDLLTAELRAQFSTLSGVQLSTEAN
jgi:hypothetical protein